MATNNAQINVQVNGQQQIDKLTNSLNGLNDKFAALGNIAKGLILGSTLQSLNKLNAALVQASRASEVGLDSVAAFAKSVKLAGGDAERAAGDIIDFVAGLTAAKQGSADAQAELAAVGITLSDLATLGNEDLFRKTVEGLLQIQDASLRNQLAVRLLGKSFKDLDIVTVGNGFKSLSGSMNTSAIQASADAQKNLAKQYGNLTTALTNVLEPLNKIAASIDISEKTFERLIKLLGILGGAFLIFAKVLPGVQTLTTATYQLLTTKGRLSRQVAALGGHLGRFVTHLKNVITAGGMAGSRLASFALAISQAVKFLLRFAGIAGIIYTVVEVFDLLIDKVFGLGSPIDWIVKQFGALYEVVSKFFGFSGTNEIAKQTEEAKKKTEAYASTVKDANQKIRDDMLKTVSAYKQVNEQQLRQIQNETELIGKGEEYKTIKDALYQSETKYLEQINEMMQKYYELQAAAENTPAFSKERATFDAYRQSLTSGMQDITKAYEQQIPAVRALTQAKNDAMEADRARLFAIQQEQDAFDKLRDLQDEIVKSTMSELEQKYYDIQVAADRAAEAGIRAAEATMGRKLTDDEAAKYYDAARKSVEDLRKATERSYKNSREFSTGWKKAFKDYVDAAGNAAKRAEQIFSKMMGGLEDLFVNFAKTGKFEWKSFVNMMVEELLRSQIQQLFGNIMGSMQGAMTGSSGLGSILGGLFGGGSGSSKGQSANNPLYVMNVGGTGAGSSLGGGIFSGDSGSSGGGIFSGISNAIGGITKGIGSVVGGITNTIGGLFGGGKSSGGGLISGGGIGGAISGAISGGGSLLSSIGSGISDLFGGFFANGGSLPAGKFGIVGERGPEMISGPANITPMSGASYVTYNINAVDAASFKALVAQDPAFIHAVAQQGAKGIPQGRR